MEKSLSLNVYSYSAGQSVHSNLPLDPILSLTIRVHIVTQYLRLILILSFYLCPGLPSDLFPSGFPTETLNTFFISPSAHYTLCLPHPYELITMLMISKETTLWNPSLCKFLHYRNTILDTVHCLRYIWHTRRYGSWLYSLFRKKLLYVTPSLCKFLH
jgi:hypothetical protein